MTYHVAMTEIPSHWPKGIKTADEVLAAALEADPEFAAEWERLAADHHGRVDRLRADNAALQDTFNAKQEP